jgi:hypothetical protein
MYMYLELEEIALEMEEATGRFRHIASILSDPSIELKHRNNHMKKDIKSIHDTKLNSHFN